MGQGVTEFNPQGQAAKEVRRLWSWIEKAQQLRQPETRVRPSRMSKSHKVSLRSIVAASMGPATAPEDRTPPTRRLHRTGTSAQDAETAREADVGLSRAPVYDQLRISPTRNGPRSIRSCSKHSTCCSRQRGARSISQLMEDQTRLKRPWLVLRFKPQTDPAGVIDAGGRSFPEKQLDELFADVAGQFAPHAWNYGSKIRLRQLPLTSASLKNSLVSRPLDAEQLRQ